MSSFFDQHINDMKTAYPSFRNYQDYNVFPLLCMKYFFYVPANAPFDPDTVIDYLTDGKNDGGIDIIFNDPSSDCNDVVVIQSKYYNNTKLSVDTIVADLHKIGETISQIQNHKVSEINEKVVSAFRNAMAQKEDEGVIRIVFFTSYKPATKKERNKLEKATKIDGFEVELFFSDDIESQIEMCVNGKMFVENDKLLIDRKDNYLSYSDSLIVNVSAYSLQELFQKRRNGLLGMNLRYYVRQKQVDDGIKKTITSEPENFWYKNNGILIICDDYELDGKEIKLTNFSIVNGGQTTNRIGNMDIQEDFFLQCKIVKAKGEDKDKRDRFALEIAEATNSQKPIKKADLKANSVEQMRLKERLATEKVYYITKKGDKAPKQYSEVYQVATTDLIGKLGLAAILQMPGSARSNSQRMFDDKYYYGIFGDATKARVYADLLKISAYYDEYLKTHVKNRVYDEKTELPMIKNGKTFQLACITLLCKINYGVFSYSSISTHFENLDVLKAIIKNMEGMSCLIKDKIDNEKECFFELFDLIGEEVLGTCFESALDKAAEEQSSLAPSDYLKLDNNYYKYIIKKLWKKYNNNTRFKQIVDDFCGVK